MSETTLPVEIWEGILAFLNKHEEFAPALVCRGSGGHLCTLQWARENGCEWDSNTTGTCAIYGHFETLKWVCENGCPWDSEHLSKCANGKHEHIRDWVREFYHL